MNKPEKQSVINEKQLDYQQYFGSLIRQAALCGLLTQSDIERISAELLKLLAQQTDRLTGGKSSSVPLETAKQLSESVAFVLGLKLKAAASPEQAVERLKNSTVEELYDRGLISVRRKIASARQIQKRISRNLFSTPNEFYSSTVIDGISAFFRLYSPAFSANEIHITADYPTFVPRPKLCGIEFIEMYLRYIEIENAFCVRFNAADVHRLLSGFLGKYEECLMNIFEPVLMCALGLTLLEKPPLELNIRQENLKTLYEMLEGQSEETLRKIFENAAASLCRELDMANIFLSYVYSCMPQIVWSVKNAIELKTLDKVFLVQK